MPTGYEVERHRAAVTTAHSIESIAKTLGQIEKHLRPPIGPSFTLKPDERELVHAALLHFDTPAGITRDMKRGLIARLEHESWHEHS
jgi:hypothetical protein